MTPSAVAGLGPAVTDPGFPMNSRAVVALTGASYFFVALGFSYLDRRYGVLGVEAFLWLVWVAIGFGAGVRNAHQPPQVGHRQWVILGCIGFALALFPGLIMFNILRWTCLALMIVIGARAATLRTQRDFYLSLTVIFVVSFMVGTHGNADWTLWFYLGPAWICGALALAWQNALGARLSRWTTMSLTMGFIMVSFLITVVVFLFVPRPQILGFGFLPPGTEAPGRFEQSQGSGSGSASKGNGTSSGQVGSGGGLGGASQGSNWADQWDRMIQGMRRSLGDKFIPNWQRNLIERLLNGAQSIFDALTGRGDGSGDAQGSASQSRAVAEEQTFKVNWLLLLATLLAAYVLWSRRYRMGVGLALFGAWMSQKYFPAQSMRLSAQGMKWCLVLHGHKRSPGQSVREHWGAATGLAPLANKWLGYAVEIYCETRFGNRPATQSQATNMRKAVQGACDVLLGVVPELAR